MSTGPRLGDPHGLGQVASDVCVSEDPTPTLSPCSLEQELAEVAADASRRERCTTHSSVLTLLQTPRSPGSKVVKRQTSPGQFSVAARSVFGNDDASTVVLQNDSLPSEGPGGMTFGFKLWWILVFVFVSINVGLSTLVSLTWYVSNWNEVRDLLDRQALMLNNYSGTCEHAMFQIAEELEDTTSNLARTLVQNFFVWPAQIVNMNVDLSLPGVGLLVDGNVSRSATVLWGEIRRRFRTTSQIYVAFPSGLYMNFMKEPTPSKEDPFSYTFEFRAPDGFNESDCSGFCPPASTRPLGHKSHYSVDPVTGLVEDLLDTSAGDPRQEEWYRLAVAGQGKVVWTECYKFVNNRSAGLRALRATFHNDEPAMVAGSDLGLHVLTDFLMEVKLAARYKRTFILCRRGYLFASSQGVKSFMKFHPDGTIWRQLSWEESEDPLVLVTVSALIKQYGGLDAVPDSGSSVDETREYVFGFQAFVPQGGFTRLASIHEHAPDWLVFTVGLLSDKMSPIWEQNQRLEEVKEEEEVTVEAEIQQRTLVTIGYCSAFTFLGALLMAVVSKLITSSLKAFALDMLSVAQLDFLNSKVSVAPQVEASVLRVRSPRTPKTPKTPKTPTSPYPTRGSTPSSSISSAFNMHVIREVAQMREAFTSMTSGLQSFARYMDPNVVHLILESRREAKLGVAPAELTIFFSDIAGFTTIAEALPPAIFMDILAEYLDEMSGVIMESSGVVGEFIGDSIMAWWNDPIVLGPGHTAIGIRAALEQQERLAALRNKWSGQDLPAVHARMGLARGSVFAGNIGSRQRMKYGLVGDSVNLASRLEGLCKTYCVDILIEDKARAAPGVDDEFWCRPLDLVQVKGRSGCTELFQVVASKRPGGHAPTASDDVRAFVQDFEAIQELYRNMHFEQAVVAIDDYLSRWHGDVPAQILRGRCKELIANAPGNEWSPVNKLDHK